MVKEESLDGLLRRFHRRVGFVIVVRAMAMLLIVLLAVWSVWEPTFLDRRAVTMVFGGVFLLWICLAISSMHQSRTLQMARVLLGTGQSDNARVWLGRVMTGLSLSPRIQFVACQHLAFVFFARSAHKEVVAICYELLRHRLGRLRHVIVNTRLMLADSLLTLDRVAEAYEAIVPVYELSLSLADRMKLLPVQLRYELTAGQSALVVRSLPEKVRVAELLDSQQAALVHAMLAEGCRQQSMSAESAFLLRRARLYADLEPLTQRYGVLLPLVSTGEAAGGTTSAQV